MGHNHQGRRHGGHRRRGGRGGRRRSDFWHDWREERRKRWQDGTHPKARHKAQVWREFFYEFMGEYPENHWAFRGRRFNPWRQGEDSFNPFVATILSKGGGLLPLIVMEILAQQPRYGNEISQEIGQRTRGQWVANPGAIYPLMTVLEEQQLVTGEWEDPRKRTVRIYELTEKGREELERLKAIVKPKLDEAIDVLEALANDITDNQTPNTV